MGSTWWPLRAWSLREGRRGAARMYGRTYGEKGAGAQTAPAMHPGKKYDVRRPPRSTQSRSSAASDVYKRQMLDHGTDTKNQKISATLHENAPTNNGTSAALHGNVFRAFMVQLGASKSSPGDRTKHSFSGVVLRFLFFGTYLSAAPDMHSS